MGCAASKPAVVEATPGTRSVVTAPAGASAVVTINPALHPSKAVAAPEVQPSAVTVVQEPPKLPEKPVSPLHALAHIADKDPAAPLVHVDSDSAPSSEDVEAFWRDCEIKHVYMDYAADILCDYFEERLQQPAAAVAALITGLLKLYKEVVEDLDIAADVQQQREQLFQLMSTVLESDRRSHWVAKQLAFLYTTLSSGLRTLGPSFVEPLELLHQQTNRPTPDAKQRVRKAVAKRLAFAAHSALTNKQVLDTMCTAVLDTKVALKLAPHTCNFTLGPRSTFSSQLWYAFAARLPETCSWRFFQKEFVEFAFWPEGVAELITALKLRDATAPAWQTFKQNLQGAQPGNDIMIFEVAAAFPQELLGARMVGALKRLFVLPSYQLPGRDTEAGVSHAVLHKLARDVDRARRENNMPEVSETLWNIIERLWYIDEAPQAALDEGIGPRALAVLELSHRQACIAYLPAAVIVCQLGPELAMEKAHVQRVGLAAKKLATIPRMQDTLVCSMLLSLARAVLLTQGGQTWPAVLAGETLHDWDDESNPLNLTLTFTHVVTLLVMTEGLNSQMLQEKDAAPRQGPGMDSLSPGLLRFHLQLRRLVLQTLFALSKFKDLRRFYGLALPGLVDESGAGISVEAALRAVEKRGLVDERVLAKLILEELTKAATEVWQNRQFSAAHSRNASIMSRRSARSVHSRSDSLDMGKIQSPTVQPPATTPPTAPEEPARPRTAKALPPPIPLATADRAAWRHQKFSYTADMFRPGSPGVVSPSASSRSEPHSLAASHASGPFVYVPASMAYERVTPPTRKAVSPAARAARKRTTSTSSVRPPWVDVNNASEVVADIAEDSTQEVPTTDASPVIEDAASAPTPAEPVLPAVSTNKPSAGAPGTESPDLPSPVTPLPEHVPIMQEYSTEPASTTPAKDYVNPVFAPTPRPAHEQSSAAIDYDADTNVQLTDEVYRKNAAQP